MEHVTYSEIAMRYGRRPALRILRTVETIADIRYDTTPIDLEARFERALKALAETDFVA
jgi:hypothetical protein